MKRTAGGLLLLAVFGGCVSDQTDPEVLNLIAQSGRQPAGSPGPDSGRQLAWPAAYPPTAGSARTDAGMNLSVRSATSPSLTAAPAPAAALASGVPMQARTAPATPSPDFDLVSATAPGPFGEIAPVAGQQSPHVIMVNTKRLILNYEVNVASPSGRTPVELWYTHNGQNWTRSTMVHDQPPFLVEVEEEGVYGFTLRAHSASGQGPPPPAPGEPPQVLVEVDLTKPTVRLAPLQADAQAKTLTILWEATDKNLIPQPIALSWARQAGGPWTPIISQLENTGRYVWKLPAGLPARVWLRIEAADMAGNVATAETPDAVVLAPSGLALQGGPQPEVSIVAVEPAASESRKVAEAEESQPPPHVQMLQLEPVGQ